MEEFNRTLFLWINATPHAPLALLMFARFIAKDLILVVPLTIVVGWLWGNAAQLPARRVIISQATLTLIITLLLAQIIGWLLPHPRPFTIGIGNQFLLHAPDSSYPSDHGCAIFSFALAFLFWSPRRRIGSVLMLCGIAIAWSRIYLGVHWPLDMIGAFLVALASCGLVHVLWPHYGDALHCVLLRLHRQIFSYAIRRGWVQA
ncbi:undecaprenyl-diphosphate phosphatase [Edwardsiella ictaluri]|uniref:undecaprenyl-diphosphate phosphatase n=2 Tax=Edwardsiella ictaluri TaxID=67780 RepID=C5BEE7_EDWI9|nr:undecaprenyl-diphosphate phosphatase [Edwardsiella ictaluri]ACR69708.1 PAP2 family protein [Edwardsiella ictaluri 93-146]AVZ83313.1 undecaprenyl-diphosphate phosphatase [Edwardsiella ictaluri]EKS7761808.1 undecaprenyl-diphosphate phosphatase [Edwardsiella ictaluri]EKS7768618.1 undecaprenyl-diphosphate phosphatase [Edwardsiella ictaluri]EKS7772064.1 undecaprenyl-diphosphate phosphatase [Edwardsiella ictaluri]